MTELKSVCLLRGLDSLGLKELYVNGQLVRAFPGSSKTVTSLKVGNAVRVDCVNAPSFEVLSSSEASRQIQSPTWA